MNIQEIITLIRSGSSNPDHREGQRQIEEAVKLLKKVQVADQWQPMDTAPKDGTEGLLAIGKGTYRGWWRECADKGGGETGPAWQIFDAGDPYESWAVESPECWRQLPFSPKYLEYVEAQARASKQSATNQTGE